MCTENISFVCVIVKKQVLILTSEPIGALTQLMRHADNAVKNLCIIYKGLHVHNDTSSVDIDLIWIVFFTWPNQ